ncbi:hypothetical protein BHE74_00030214 [Ensete ventricosum]|nr:hypothetical protein BHE74_00030214 [Ensete ventricosum]
MRTAVLKHLSTAGEDDDPHLCITEDRKFIGLLEQPSPPLGEGHLAVRRVLDPLDLYFSTTHPHQCCRTLSPTLPLGEKRGNYRLLSE